MLIVVGDFSGVSKASACVIVRQVTEAICTLANIYISLPNTAVEIQEAKEKFYNIARFPMVIGAVDCTHVRIQSPGGDQAERFRNRKGYFSWNVQAVCNADLQIIDLVVRWPGSTHDQTIFNNSRLKVRMENMENTLLIGDSGYGLTNYLITPLAAPATPPENLFNESHIRTRNCIERCFGVWKRRFPILSYGMRVCLERSQSIIIATAVLHNIAIIEKNGEPPGEMQVVEDVIDDGPQLAQEHVLQDNRMRMSLVNNHFANILGNQ